MRANLALLLSCSLTLPALAQNSYTATYANGDIQSDIGFTSLPGASSCAAQLSVMVPAGEMIDSAVVDYTFYSSMAGFGSPAMQRSQIRCVTTGQAEQQLALAVNPGLTTATYHRTLNLANGPCTGPVTYEMHAGNTGLLGGPCSSLHVIMDGTWTITVHTSALSTDLNDLGNEAARMWLDAANLLRCEGLEEGPAQIGVYDALGRQLLYRSVSTGGGGFSLQLEATAPGMLLVRVVQDGRVLDRRLMRP